MKTPVAAGRARGGSRGLEALVARRLGECGVAATRPRRIIAGILLSRKGHLDAGELLARARAEEPRIGQATVYRTLELLTRRGLLEELRFGEGWRRWEQSGAQHHDHLLCTRCGAIAEFDQPEIETLQLQVARAKGFSPTSHLMVIYGTCPSCGPAGGRSSNG